MNRNQKFVVCSAPRLTSESVDLRRIPMFGPLNIKSEKEFLNKSKAFFKQRSSQPFPYVLNLNNFEPLYEIGSGSFGRVILVRYKVFEKSYYAMKIIDKKSLVKQNLVEFASREKRILQSLNHPFCIRLEYFTTDSTKLYYILPFIAGGELFSHIRNLGKMNENLSKFLAGQMVLALEFLHYCGIIHRDIKPENVILDHFGYVKIADFGFAKDLKGKLRAYTFCGTPEYIAPEVVLGSHYSFPVDWWAVGVILIEMVTGRSPFHSKDTLKTYQKIVDADYLIPPEFSPELADLVSGLLQVDVSRRLGNLSLGVGGIKQHEWFKEIVWLDLLNRRIVPPYIPPMLGDFNTGYFPHFKKLPSSFAVVASSDSFDPNDPVFKEF